MKYGWAGTGMVVIAIPILTSRKSTTGEHGLESAAFDRTEYYSTAKNLLTSGADAMERLMTAYKASDFFPANSLKVKNRINQLCS